MKICLSCHHLITRWRKYDGDDVPENFRQFLELYCCKKQCNVFGYDTTKNDRYCDNFEKN